MCVELPFYEQVLKTAQCSQFVSLSLLYSHISCSQGSFIDIFHPSTRCSQACCNSQCFDSGSIPCFYLVPLPQLFVSVCVCVFCALKLLCLCQLLRPPQPTNTGQCQLNPACLLALVSLTSHLFTSTFVNKDCQLLNPIHLHTCSHCTSFALQSPGLPCPPPRQPLSSYTGSFVHSLPEHQNCQVTHAFAFRSYTHLSLPSYLQPAHLQLPVSLIF